MAVEYRQSDFVSSLPLFSTLSLEYAVPGYRAIGAVGLDSIVAG